MLSVHSSFSLKLFYSAQFCTCHRGQKVLWKFASFMDMQTWDKLALNCVLFQLLLLDLSAATHFSSFQTLLLFTVYRVSFSLTKAETLLPGRKRIFKKIEEMTRLCWSELGVILSQVCWWCSGGFGQQWVAFKGRLSYLILPLLFRVTRHLPEMVHHTVSWGKTAARHCKATSFIFQHVWETQLPWM